MAHYITTILVTMRVGIFHLVIDLIFLFDILIVRITVDIMIVILIVVTIVALEEVGLCVRIVFEGQVWPIGFN